ncbi:bicyclomycin resistance protein [Xylariomycetidae sp. FL0641]|nr:bicyclomycin resistance protein [Xylariomycetidae sp. FL0641]
MESDGRIRRCAAWNATVPAFTTVTNPVLPAPCRDRMSWPSVWQVGSCLLLRICYPCFPPSTTRLSVVLSDRAGKNDPAGHILYLSGLNSSFQEEKFKPETRDMDADDALGDERVPRRLPSMPDLKEILEAPPSTEDKDLEKADDEGLERQQTREEECEGIEDPNIVWWDSEDDPENPYNWPVWRKSLNVGLVSLMVFVSPLASSAFAPGVPRVMDEFHSNSLEISTFVVSVYVLGYAAGPVVIAPLSEIYGRVIVYHICAVGFVAFLAACALAPSLDSLIAFRFLCGVFGSAPITNGGGTIADMVTQEHRGTVIAIYSIGPLFGPIIGPIVGGVLTEAKGWRWVFWLLAIVGAACGLVMGLTLKESYAPVLLQRKTERLRKESGNEALRSKLDDGLSPRDFFKRGLVRPVKMLMLSPITVVTAIYMSINYGYIYILFTTMTEVFQGTYGFSTSTVGLSFLGVGIGSLIGIAIHSLTSDRFIQKKAKEAQQENPHMGPTKNAVKPEYRLPLLPYGAALIPAGLFIYGWTAENKVHWIAPMIGTAVMGCGSFVVFMAIQTYLVDAYVLYAASALATNTIVRSIAGATLPLAGLRLYARLGLGWGNSLLGFISMVLLPVSWLIIRYGEYLRTRFPIKNL